MTTRPVAQRRWIVGFAAVAIVAAACRGPAPTAGPTGAATVDDPPAVSTTDPTISSTGPDTGSFPSTTLPAAVLPPPADGKTGEGSRELSDYQAAVLADGEVTFEEYEASVLATIACLQDAGIRTTGPKPAHAGRMLSWTLSPPEGMADEEFFAAESACLTEYLSVVETAWLEAARPDEQTMVEYAAKLTECLNDAGAELEAGLTEIEILKVVLGGNSPWDIPRSRLEPCLTAYAFSFAG